MNNKFMYGMDVVSASFVEKKGEAIGVVFPKDYVDFIVLYNGGSPELPCFSARNRRGRERPLKLHYMFAFTDEFISESVVLMNDSFIDWGVRDAGYWIIGDTEEEAGHLLLDCKKNEVVLCDLNASYGIPEGGPSLSTGKTFGDFIASLTADPKGKWTPRAWI
jgi:hypothetical protein